MCPRCESRPPSKTPVEAWRARYGKHGVRYLMVLANKYPGLCDACIDTLLLGRQDDGPTLSLKEVQRADHASAVR